MVLVSAAPHLDASRLELFYATEPALSNSTILVLHGSSPSLNGSSATSSRIQCHVYTVAGFQSFTRLAISPSSPLYSAVGHLSAEEQGDEICRALAYTLFKYFSELPTSVKEVWTQQFTSADQHLAARDLFTDSHAARLASRMRPLDDPSKAICSIESALVQQTLSCIDMDVILPLGSIKSAPLLSSELARGDYEEDDRHGKYTALVRAFGDFLFIPTSKLRRAPSRPLASQNSRAVFTRQQKEFLRRELCEFVETEERYLEKLNELLHDVAGTLRQNAADSTTEEKRGQPSSALETLFPSSLRNITDLSAELLSALSAIVDETESQAIKDIQDDTSAWQTNEQSIDATGAKAFADCLLAKLPLLGQPYADYIERHPEFPRLLKTLTEHQDSSVPTAIHDIGEQKIMSLLIEPVQRLPRYSLYLENILKQLPRHHPATSVFLKAKDMIADICVQEQTSQKLTRASEKLQQLVGSWPSSLQPQSRIVAAADLIEPVPVEPGAGRQQRAMIALIFVDMFVILRKSSASKVSAKGLMTELDTASAYASTEQEGLIYAKAMPLENVTIVEAGEENMIKLIFTSHGDHKVTSTPRESAKLYTLGGLYQGKAGRFVKDFLTAKTERRFTERQRESGKWEARVCEESATTAGFLTAVYEADVVTLSQEHSCSPLVTIVVDEAVSASTNGSGIQVALSAAGEGFFRVETRAEHDSHMTRDLVTAEQLRAVLGKRIAALLPSQLGISSPGLTASLLLFHDANIAPLMLSQHRRSRSPSKVQSLPRAHSPVKALTNFFGGRTMKEKSEPAIFGPVFDSVSKTAPELRPHEDTKPHSVNHFEHVAASSPKKSNAVRLGGESSAASSAMLLEKSLSVYVLALHARKGNVVGKVISGRQYADPEAVSRLYVAVLRQPHEHEQAAHASVEILFAAFEQFIKNAWRDKFGPLLEIRQLDELQHKAGVLEPLDFEEEILKVISELSPQNQRALKSVLRLLVDLLDGTVNDGDRGALMATFTEIVVPEGDAYAYMSLFDRLVEEHDVVLGEYIAGVGTPHEDYPTVSAMTSSARSGSIASKASSLGRRFGLGSMRRDNSGAESGSRVGSVFRNMSKRERSAERQAESGLNRKQSVSSTSRSSPRSRPGSRDHRLATGSTGSRPNSAHLTETATQSKALSEDGPGSNPSGRRKRRSSLSDLPSLPMVNQSPLWGTPILSRHQESPVPNRTPAHVSGRTAPLPLQVTSSAHRNDPGSISRVGPAPGRFPAPVTPTASPTRSNASRHESQDKKENSSPSLEHAISTLPRAFRSTAIAYKPKGPLTERTGSGNTPPPLLLERTNQSDLLTAKLSTPSTISISSSPNKELAARSGQRMLERLHEQQATIKETEEGLQAELAKIGQELSAVNLLTASPTKTTGLLDRSISTNSATPTRGTVQNISTRLRALETRIPHLVSSLNRETLAIERDYATALEASERRCRELEEQLRLQKQGLGSAQPKARAGKPRIVQ